METENGRNEGMEIENNKYETTMGELKMEKQKKGK